MWSLNKLSVIKFILLVQFLIYLSSYTIAQPNLDSHNCQDTFGNYTSKSPFQRNLNTLFSEITSNTKINYGFYNFSVGKDFNIVNGIGLCRPDVLLNDCHQCLQQATTAIVEQCPNQKDATGWYQECMIRYTNRYIFGKMELTPRYNLNSTLYGVSKAKFNDTAATLLAKLQTEAASGDSRLKYGAGTVKITSSYTIYALVQCTPDLDYFDCYNCLDNAIGFALTNLYGLQARVFFVSCNIRYESFPFYDSNTLMSLMSSTSPPPPVSSSPPLSSSKGLNMKSKTLIAVLVPVTTSLLHLLSIFPSKSLL